MKKRYAFSAALFAVLILCLLCLETTAAHAQLRIDFTPSTLAGSNGSTLTFSGNLTNLGAEDIRIAGDTFSLEGNGLTLDDTSFLLTFPETLAAGNSVGGDFFTILLGPDPQVAPGSYNGTFTVFAEGLTTGGGVESTASFQVVAVPEPGTYALLLSGGVTLGLVARRRTSRRRVAHLA